MPIEKIPNLPSSAKAGELFGYTDDLKGKVTTDEISSSANITLKRINTKNLPEAITLAESGVGVPNECEYVTASYHPEQVGGGNNYILKDAENSANRPDEKLGEVYHIGSDGLYFQAGFEKGYKSFKQYGAIADHNGAIDGTSTGTNNFDSYIALCSGYGKRVVEVGDYFVDYDRGLLTNESGAFVRPDGELYGQNPENLEELESEIEAAHLWYNLETGGRASLEGVRGSSNIYCGEQVISLMAATGLRITGVNFYGGFDPGKKDSILKPLLILNEHTEFTQSDIFYTYGSSVFNKYGPAHTHHCTLNFWGDHAVYVSSDDVEPEDETVGIEIHDIVLNQSPEYNTRALDLGSRPDIKIRSRVKSPQIYNITGKGGHVFISFEGENPSDGIINGPTDVNFHDIDMSQEAVAESATQTVILSKVKGTTFTGRNITARGDGGVGDAIAVSEDCEGCKLDNIKLTGYNVGFRNTAGAGGFANSSLTNSTLDGGDTGILNLGTGAKIHSNTIKGQSSRGVSDKYGNDVHDNDINLPSSASQCIFVQREATLGGLDFTWSYTRNRMIGSNIPIHLTGLDESDKVRVVGNEFTGGQSHSLFATPTADAAVMLGEYYDNIVHSGPTLPLDLQQGIKEPVVSALPPATQYNRGKTIIVESSDVDTVYKCLKTGVDTFAWVAI